MTANFKSPFDLTGNAYVVLMPVKVQHNVHGAEQLEVEGIARRNELP
jgi:hypothetical protein